MLNLRCLLVTTIAFSMLTMGIPTLTLAQAGPSPDVQGAPISDLDRLTRERDTNKRFFSKTMATLHLTYQSSGDLKSSLLKKEGHSVFMTVEVDGDLIKGIAKNKKPKVQEAVRAGPIEVKGRWARPGTRLQTKCAGELTVGFQQIVFLPYGGTDGFSCHVETRILPDAVYDAWKDGFDLEQTGAYGACATQHPRGSTEFWTCIDQAGMPFPQA